MAERLLDMIWRLTMPVDGPPELLQTNVISDVLEQYEGQGHHNYLRTYLARCVEQLRGKQNSYTALHVLQNLVRLQYPAVSAGVGGGEGMRASSPITNAALSYVEQDKSVASEWEGRRH